MNVAIRAADQADAGPIARVHIDSWRTTYEGIVPAEYLAGLSYRDRESRWNEALTTDHLATGIFVAETAGGDVVGFTDGVTRQLFWPPVAPSIMILTENSSLFGWAKPAARASRSSPAWPERKSTPPLAIWCRASQSSAPSSAVL